MRSWTSSQVRSETEVDLSQRHKAYMINFIELMTIRNPYDLDQLSSFAETIVNAILAEISILLEKSISMPDFIGDPPTYARDHVVGRLLPHAIRHGTKTMITENMQIKIVKLTRHTTAITSDRPVVPFNIDSQRVFYFPAAHDIVILMSSQEDGDLDYLLEDGPLSGGIETMYHLNKLMVDQAIEFVYAFPETLDSTTFQLINHTQTRRNGQPPIANPFLGNLKVDRKFIRKILRAEIKV